MDELRWFLIIVGTVVIVAVIVYGRIDDWRRDGFPWSRRRRDERVPFQDDGLSEDDLQGTLDELDTLISEQRSEIRPPQGPDRAAGSDVEETRGSAGDTDAQDHEPNPTESAAGTEPSLEEPAAGPPPSPPTPSKSRSSDAVAADEHVEGVGEGTAGAQREREHAPVGSRFGDVSQRFRSVFSGVGGTDRTAPVDESSSGAESDPGEEKIVSLNVMAPEGTHFVGPALVEALEAAGLRHGEHGIYHRTLDTRNGAIALYSVANIVKPGWFDLERIEEFDTPGVAFFLQLPGPFDGLAAFEQMLQAAREVASQLGGHLLDARRCDLTQQSIEHVREELLEYRRRAHIAARHARQ